MAHRVVFAPEALDDLRGLYDLIADASLPARALAYVQGLRRFCLGLAEFPERGTRRDAIRPGLRTLGYRRRVTVAFHVTGTAVVIDRLLYGGRDLEGLLGEEDAEW
ncbi:type II toxin-antitoxin system RelE/ParE family toxin [Falsiroseomonas sp.]|uniref:type II toxin-antitoxin system RelE/ParE family toxin n=1 Tax=Falsiroseomonas sp. TaxID=2870721 RepID=UPI003F71C2D4